ncbi:MAG: hypothetical protein ACXWLH_02935, partial [Candidatus Saccharimonadales bacterium]
IFKRRKKRDYPSKVHQKWLDIQRLCANKKNWAVAVVRADRLLEDALKHAKYKGKTIGERLVAAQRQLSDNDGVWYAHNLAKTLKSKKGTRIREAEVKKALVGFRQALRDLGVMNGK